MDQEVSIIYRRKSKLVSLAFNILHNHVPAYLSGYISLCPQSLHSIATASFSFPKHIIWGQVPWKQILKQSAAYRRVFEEPSWDTGSQQGKWAGGRLFLPCSWGHVDLQPQVVLRGALKLQWPFKDALKGGKGPRPLHHHITGCHMDAVSLEEAAPFGWGDAQWETEMWVSTTSQRMGGWALQRGSECRVCRYLPESSTTLFCLGCSAPTFLPHRILRILETIWIHSSIHPSLHCTCLLSAYYVLGPF